MPRKTFLIIKRIFKTLKKQRLNIILVIAIISTLFAGLLQGFSSFYLDISKDRYDDLKDVYSHCYSLNIEAVSIKTNLMALDDYVDTMVDEGLMTAAEADTILWKYLYESFYYAIQLVHESCLDLYPEFISLPNIKIYTTVQNLIDEIEFCYNHTDDLLLAISGNKPETVYITNFNMSLIRDVIDDFFQNTVIKFSGYETFLFLAFTISAFISGVCASGKKH
ncbi:MAG: hypothetical protein ACFFA2_15025, partial [Promethearchaeota archaeon]